MNRRDVMRASGIAMAIRLKKAAADEKPAARRRVMAFVVYPEFTALDLVGPHQVLSAVPGFETHDLSNFFWDRNLAFAGDSRGGHHPCSLRFLTK